MLLSYYNTKDKPHLLLVVTRDNVHPWTNDNSLLPYLIQASSWQWFSKVCFICEEWSRKHCFNETCLGIWIKYLSNIMWQYRMIYSWIPISKHFYSDSTNSPWTKFSTAILRLVLHSVKGSKSMRLWHDISTNIFHLNKAQTWIKHSI